MRRLREAALELGVALAAIMLALAAGALVLGAKGANPLRVYRYLFLETLAKPYYLGQTIFKATTLVFTGIAAAFSFRAGMFNIGGQGQLYLGAFFCALVGVWLPPGTPAILAVPLLVATAAAGGAIAAFPAALLKAYRGTHEVLSTLMLNFVILAIVNWLLLMVAVKTTVQTPPILESGRLPQLSRFASGMHGSEANLSVVVAVAACLAAAWIYARTRLGYELRAVGANPRAAEFGAVSIRRMTILSLVVSGALAGLGGINYVVGSKRPYFEHEFAPGQGYLGIAVALLARNNPIAVIPAAFLFAVLSEGGLAIQKFVPKEFGEILQGFVIVLVVVAVKVFERARARRPRSSSDD